MKFLRLIGLSNGPLAQAQLRNYEEKLSLKSLSLGDFYERITDQNRAELRGFKGFVNHLFSFSALNVVFAVTFFL